MANVRDNVTKFPVVTQAVAYSPAGPREGFRDITVSSTPETVDLTAYKGKLIQIHVTGSDQGTGFYVCFVAATGATLDTDAAAMSGGLFADLVVDELEDGYRDIWVVPHDKPILKYRTIGAGGNGRIHIRRA